MSNNVVETEGPQMTSQYGAYALHAGLARLHARMRMRMHMHMHMPKRPRTHLQARTRMHTHQYVIILNSIITYLWKSNNTCFSTATIIVNAPQCYMLYV